ncbi:hypothetical protein J7T55_015342 [Diaporthe amygdali]|uniref:uncharacterized protein n=1 Tax=Phomopsis amygdali TaxID=1214568 RepID=UPI0022FDB0F5|nr:uncharacterized protein J7T55_015342 [Diaporthe amygdali]KAJ0120612.1 hypothetical protein J7T55_015342 [Diaporthe amygdali]
MSSDKRRIFFCVYFEQGPRGTQGTPRVFHCGLWVEEKGSKGPGDYFHIQFHPVYSNRPDYPSGWVYSSSTARSREENWREPSQLIGRILLGKLAPGVTASHIHEICRTVARPNDREDCWDWTGRAISAIQLQRYLTRHSWSGPDGLKARAYQQSCSWWEKDKGRIPNKPHYWDIYGTESSHCVVM